MWNNYRSDQCPKDIQRVMGCTVNHSRDIGPESLSDKVISGLVRCNTKKMRNIPPHRVLKKQRRNKNKNHFIKINEKTIIFLGE